LKEGSLRLVLFINLSPTPALLASTSLLQCAQVKTTSNLSAFFKDPRRACVALSRAKHLSIVVGRAAAMGGMPWGRVARAYERL